jgi:hypothetical protein
VVQQNGDDSDRAKTIKAPHALHKFTLCPLFGSPLTLAGRVYRIQRSGPDSLKRPGHAGRLGAPRRASHERRGGPLMSAEASLS